MPDIQNANNAPRCEHLKFDDVRCGAPALRGRRFCRFHASARSTHEPFPTIEDGLSLQVGLNQIVRSVIDGSLERKTASLVLYAFQIMCSNLKRMNEERKLAQKTKDEDELPGPSLAETLLERLDHLLEEDPPEDVVPAALSQDDDNASACGNQKSKIENQKWFDRGTGVPPEPHSDGPLVAQHEVLGSSASSLPSPVGTDRPVLHTNNQSPTTNHALPNAQSPAPKAPAVVDKIHACAEPHAPCLMPCASPPLLSPQLRYGESLIRPNQEH